MTGALSTVCMCVRQVHNCIAECVSVNDCIASLCAPRAFVLHVLVFVRFILLIHLGIGGWPRFVIVALPGLFYLTFFGIYAGRVLRAFMGICQVCLFIYWVCTVDTYFGTILPLYGISYYIDIGWKHVKMCDFYMLNIYSHLILW